MLPDIAYEPSDTTIGEILTSYLAVVNWWHDT